MITKIIKHTFRTKESIKYLANYEVHGPDGEFGYIGLRPDGEVIFKFVGIEYDSLDLQEMCLLCAFMDRLSRIFSADELNLPADEFYERT